jgi:hypothetical protein
VPIVSLKRFFAFLGYPVKEQNVNDVNRASAAAKIGGDKVTTKLFWDKFKTTP